MVLDIGDVAAMEMMVSQQDKEIRTFEGRRSACEDVTEIADNLRDFRRRRSINNENWITFLQDQFKQNIDKIRKFGDFIDEKSPASEASAQQILRQHINNKSAVRALFNCARFFPLTSCHEAVNKVGASSVKVLVLHGDEDKTVRPTPSTTVWAKALTGRNDGVSRVELVRGAHAFSLEYPEAIGKTLVEWLLKAGGAGDDLNRK